MIRHHVLRLLLVSACALAFSPLGRAADPEVKPLPSIDGTWRWNFTMPDGTVSRPKLILETEDGKLSGSTSFRPGNDAPITNVVFQGNLLRFQVVRERGGKPIITSYAGVWSGKFIRGKVQSNWSGEPQSYDWEAERAHEGAEGTWKWAATFRGRKFEARVKLQQEGELLTGSVPGSGRGGRRIRITEGSVQNGEVYFEIERGAGETKVLTIYKGKLTGDTIKGTIETVVGGKKTEAPWEAHRID
jgi:hypothetical protein